MPADHEPRYTTRELSIDTWPHFVRLFSQGGGWDFCGCMVYQRGSHLSGKEFRSRTVAQERNLQDKKDLLANGQAHGILVYDDENEPIGWCAFGPVEELPIGGRATSYAWARPHDLVSDWRIPCFVTHKRHRGKGVANLALASALESIQRQGGGWVEATPLAHAHTDRLLDQLTRTHGPDSTEVADHLLTHPWPERSVRGIGPVPAVNGTIGGRGWVGTVSMFERHGFDAVRILNEGYVLMRRQV